MVEEEDEGELFQLTETAIKIKTLERQKWTDAYNEDAKLKAAIQELCKGHRYSDFSLSPEGLLLKKAGTREKIVVPISMRQRVVKECHDVPTSGHVGIRRTLELVDHQFH